MQATADTLRLSPPPMGSGGVSLVLALAVHGLLLLALAWGVSWQRDTTVVMEAELWSSLPQIAAPRAQEPEVPPPAPRPPPPAREPLAAPPPPAPEATEIALQRKREQEQREAERQRQAQREVQRKAEEAKRQADKLAQQQAAQRERERQQAREQAEAARLQAQLEAERQKNLERMMGQANASGSARSTGTAAVSSGPSASYAGRLVARIKPNIVFTETLPGNPRAEVEVRSLPDGTVLSARLLQSSGHTGWDNAVLRAVERTGKLPQDENGRVPATLILGFRPQD